MGSMIVRKSLSLQIIELRQDLATMNTENKRLQDEVKRLQDIVDSANSAAFDFDYTVAVSIQRFSETHTLIECMPNRDHPIQKFLIRCTPAQHQQYVAEFVKIKSK